MSVPATTDSSVPAVPSDTATGLEDYDPTTDAIMPTIRIDHKKGVFVDALSNEEFESLDVVILGLIKQRVLWDAEVADDNKPLCRSFNFTEGHPDIVNFPWKATNGVFQAPAADAEGVVLPCESCPLKEWNTHPKGNTPWCSEQHTLPVMQEVNGRWVPSLFTVQRSSITPSKKYLTSFAKSNTPVFTVRTTITLDLRKRGQVDFAVPKFAKGEATPEDLYPLFAENYYNIRNFVQTPRAFNTDDDDSSAPTTAPVAAPATAAPAPGPAPAAPSAPIDANSAPAPAPAAPAPAPQAAASTDDLPF